MYRYLIRSINFYNKWLLLLQLLVGLFQLLPSNTYAQIIEKYYAFQPGGVVILSSCKNTDYVILAGSYLPNGDGITYTQNTKSQGAIFCCNGNGDTIWTKLEGDPDSIKRYNDFVTDYGDGTFFLVGDDASISNVGLGFFLKRFNYSNGNLLLNVAFPDSSHYQPERIKKFSDGNLLISGNAKSSNNIYKPFFLLTDTLGNVIWYHLVNHNYPNYYTLAGTSEIIEYPDSFKALILRNYCYPEIITIKKDGTFLSLDSLGLCPTSMTVLAFDTLDNQSISVLGSSNMPPYLAWDFFEFKYSNSVYFDTLKYGLLSSDAFSSFFKDINENVFFSGSSLGNSPFSSSNYDAITLFGDSFGNVQWYILTGDSTYDDDFIKTYIAGSNSYISVGNTIRNTASGVLNHAYFVKYETLDVVSNIEPNSHFTKNEHLIVFPNPAKEELYIKLNGYSQKGETDSEYALFDAKGNSVLGGLLPINAITSLNVSNLVAGIYCLVVKNGDTIISKKVIIE